MIIAPFLYLFSYLLLPPNTNDAIVPKSANPIQGKEVKYIYLTFDDGPNPQITEWVLDQLQQYDAKATFFCIGNNIEKNPEIFQKIIDENEKNKQKKDLKIFMLI